MTVLAMPNRYPDSEPWVDLHEFAVNGWQMGSAQSSFNFFAKITGNEVKIQLHTRGGVDRQITSALPDHLLPEVAGSLARYWTLPGWQRSRGSVVLELHSDGTLWVPEWGGGIADGSNSNIVCQATYVRRVQ